MSGQAHPVTLPAERPPPACVALPLLPCRAINFLDALGCGRFSDSAEVFLLDFHLGGIIPKLGPCTTVEYRFQLQASKPTAVSGGWRVMGWGLRCMLCCEGRVA